ncbi:MAG: MFS transporter [Gammaproteobacteria bacterium]|jgi:MFS family permease
MTKIIQNNFIINKLQPYLVCIVAALSLFYACIQMTQLNAIGHLLAQDLKINYTSLGTLSSVYFWANVIFLLPAGLLIDRFSKKMLLLITLALTIICLGILSTTSHLAIASWCFCIMGLCGACAFLLPLSIIANWFPVEKQACISSIIITIGLFGAITSHVLLTWITKNAEWRVATQWNVVLGIIIFVITLLAVKDYPNKLTKLNNDTSSTCLKCLLNNIGTALKNPHNWYFGLYACLVNLPILIFGAVFGMSYLKHVFHFTEAQAASANSLLFAGTILGSLAFGWLANKIKRKKLLMYLGAAISLILILILMHVRPLASIVIYMLFLALGIFTSSQVIIYPAILENNEPEHHATSLSLSSILIMAGGVITLPLFGLLLDFHHKIFLSLTTLTYLAEDYKFALWILPVSFILSIIVVTFGKEEVK